MTLNQQEKERFLQALDADPQFLAEVRNRLLSPELAQLPERFAELVQAVAELSANFEAFAKETNRRLTVLEEHAVETNRRLTNLETDVAELKGGQQRLEREVSSLRDDVGVLKGDAALRATRIVTYDIARDMGHRIVRDLTRAEVRAMSREQSLPDMPRNGLRSFAVADAIIEATTSDGNIGYVAVEASYTADERDTFRAVRNAHYLRRMTGQPAWAAISALRIDQRIQNMVERGIVHWHQLEPEDFTPE